MSKYCEKHKNNFLPCRVCLASDVISPPKMPQESFSDLIRGVGSAKEQNASGRRVGAGKIGRPKKEGARRHVISIRVSDEVKNKLDLEHGDNADIISKLILENL